MNSDEAKPGEGKKDDYFCQWCYDRGLRYPDDGLPWRHGSGCPHGPVREPTPTDQLADLTARLKQAEAERDAALKKIPRNLAEACYAEDRNQDELFERINLIMGTRPIEECTQADFKWACGNCWTDGYDGSVEIVRAPDWPPLTDEHATAILDLGFHCIYESPPGVEDYADVGTCWTRKGKSTCSARSYSDNKPREAKAIRDRDAALAKLAEAEKEHSVLRGAVISALGLKHILGGSKAALAQLIKNP